MTHLNNKKNNNKNHPIAATSATSTISVLAIAVIMVAASTAIITPVAAQQIMTTTPTGNTTTTTTSPAPTSGIKLSPHIVLQEGTTTTSQTPINQTHMMAAFSGNGTLILPGSTQTIKFTTKGTGLISLATHSVEAKETLTTEQGETATSTIYEITKFNPAAPSQGKGLTMAIIQTGSTGLLAPLNGTILAGISDLQPSGQNSVKLWEWESGIVSSSNNTSASNISGTSNNSTGISAAPPTTQGLPSMNNNNSTITANEVPLTSSR